MAAPLDVPVGYHIAMGAPLGLHASASSSLSAPHPDPLAPPAYQARRPDSYQRRRTAAMSASAWLRRTTAGTPGHCVIGAGGPPHRRSTSPPGPQRPGAKAPPAFHRRLSPPRSQACVPFVLSAASAAALCATMRLRGRPGGRRSTPQLEQRPLGSRPLCFCPFLCPLANRRMRIRFGGALLGAPEIVPAGSS